MAVAEGQPMGAPMAFGGPYLGMLAVAAGHVRRLPGRLVGQTVDGHERTAYVTTLRAREQDIRREKASSNICTNQTLVAVAAMVQTGVVGHARACGNWPCVAPGAPATCARPCSASPGWSPWSARPVLREFALRLPVPADVVVERMADEGFLAGIAVEAGGGEGLLVAVTEKRTRAEMDAYVAALEKVVAVTGAAPGGRASSAPLLGHDAEPTVFDLSVPGRRAASFRTTGVPEWTAEQLVPAEELRPEPPPLAEVSERDLVAHVTRLSHRQYSVDLGAYPLGSCTMKYNPKVCDEAAALPGLTGPTRPHRPPTPRAGWPCCGAFRMPCAG